MPQLDCMRISMDSISPVCCLKLASAQHSFSKVSSGAQPIAMRAPDATTTATFCTPAQMPFLLGTVQQVSPLLQGLQQDMHGNDWIVLSQPCTHAWEGMQFTFIHAMTAGVQLC